MRCDKVDKLLPFFQDGTLEAGIAREVGDHLTQCAKCRDEFRKLDDMVYLARAGLTERTALPRPGYVSSVQERIRKRKREQTLISWAVPAAAALFLTVSVTTSVFLFHDTSIYRTAGHTPAATQTATRTQAVDENAVINAMYHYSNVTLDDVMNRMDESELAVALDSSER